MKIYSREHIGREYKIKNDYVAKVIDGGSKNGYCTIEVSDWVSEVSVCSLKKAQVKYPYHPSVHGVGYIGVGKYKVSKNKIHYRSYYIWSSILQRCYSAKSQDKCPTYIGCKISESWKNYQNFAEWFVINNVDNFHLDKDLLVKGNKIYSEYTCVFIPQELNKFMTNNQSTNTSGYTGVNQPSKNGKWLARINDIDTNKKIRIGLFDTAIDAFNSYKKVRTVMAYRLKHKMILKYGITDIRILDAIDKL